MTERVVDFVECLTSIALIGAGGVEKNATTLTVFHDGHIKRRFIRCDKFPASLASSIGVSVENLEDLLPYDSFYPKRTYSQSSTK